MESGRKNERRYSWLPRISVGRPVTVLMIFCALVLLGAVALRKLPVQLMPSGFDPAFMMVRVPYPAANPTEVEEEIILPLENALYISRDFVVDHQGFLGHDIFFCKKPHSQDHIGTG